MNIKLKVLMIGLLISTLISGCVEKPPQNDKSVNTSSSTPLFPTQKEIPASYMEARLVGELVISNDCLRVDNYLVVWPHGFSISTDGGVIHIINNTGKSIAHVGDKVKLGGGGGEMPDESIAKYSAELPNDRCSGPYFIVGEVLTK